MDAYRDGTRHRKMARGEGVKAAHRRWTPAQVVAAGFGLFWALDGNPEDLFSMDDLLPELDGVGLRVTRNWESANG